MRRKLTKGEADRSFNHSLEAIGVNPDFVPEGCAAVLVLWRDGARCLVPVVEDLFDAVPECEICGMVHQAIMELRDSQGRPTVVE